LKAIVLERGVGIKMKAKYVTIALEALLDFIFMFAGCGNVNVWDYGVAAINAAGGESEIS
jgi:hypothetical protein